jgi:hypothetical protein
MRGGRDQNEQTRTRAGLLAVPQRPRGKAKIENKAESRKQKFNGWRFRRGESKTGSLHPLDPFSIPLRDKDYDYDYD